MGYIARDASILLTFSLLTTPIWCCLGSNRKSGQIFCTSVLRVQYHLTNRKSGEGSFGFPPSRIQHFASNFASASAPWGLCMVAYYPGIVSTTYEGRDLAHQAVNGVSNL